MFAAQRIDARADHMANNETVEKANILLSLNLLSTLAITDILLRMRI